MMISISFIMATKTIRGKGDEMKTEDEIREELEKVNAYKTDEVINAMSQALQWMVDENVMAPGDYLALSGKR